MLAKQAIVLLQLIQYPEKHPYPWREHNTSSRSQPTFPMKNQPVLYPERLIAKGTAAGFAAFLFCL
jgi:hypothetical protein